MPKAKKKTAKRAATKAKAPKTKAPKKSGASKSVVARIKEVVVPPATKSEPVLVTPLPQKEVRNFGAMPFESQAKLILETFPADAAEIIGTTDNSGAGTVSAPPIAKP
ncbi:hypothetical protein EKK58_01100 [Candidatus Dependentiae bacterium]|nr:MAG: hypothetical protein EKK58_01100 [Candidatus Dependentiae bacterium]